MWRWWVKECVVYKMNAMMHISILPSKSAHITFSLPWELQYSRKLCENKIDINIVRTNRPSHSYSNSSVLWHNKKSTVWKTRSWNTTRSFRFCFIFVNDIMCYGSLSNNINKKKSSKSVEQCWKYLGLDLRLIYFDSDLRMLLVATTGCVQQKRKRKKKQQHKTCINLNKTD